LSLTSGNCEPQTPRGLATTTDAQAAIKRMASEEPGPGQMYAGPGKEDIAGQARHHHRDPVVPRTQGYPRERESRRVGQIGGRGARRSWGGMAAILGSVRRASDVTPSLAHLNRESSEKKWAEARRWAEGRVRGKKSTSCRVSSSRMGVVAGSSKSSPQGSAS
jgi:hypothetical protein